MKNENKRVALKSIEMWATRNFNDLTEIYDINCVHHNQKKHKNYEIIGINAWKKCMEEFLVCYPDYREKVIYQISEDDKVVSYIDCHASSISWSGVIIDRIENGKIKETWSWFKQLS